MTAPQPARIEKVFDRLKEFYGAQFLDKWGDVDPAKVERTWSAALERFTNEEIGDAMRSLLETSPFPPSLPEFVQRCSKAHQARQPATQSAFKLPAPDTSAEGKAAREKAAALLRSVGKPQPGREWARKARARHKSGEHRLTPSELLIVDDALRFEPVEAAA